ncbi:MAG TPA: hypothetical protein VFF73_23765 [Planctomycetota bacterium]|nr:hypothetical protein [Planctomycetota bacterium]
MSDPELRELERRVAEGDVSARVALAAALLRAGRSLEPLLGLVLADAGVARAAADLTARARARLAAHLAALDAPRVVEWLKAPATFALYRLATGGKRALVARPRNGTVALALEEAASAPAHPDVRRWWRREFRSFSRPLPVEVRTSQFPEVALAFLAALGTPFPQGEKPTVTATTGDVGGMDDVTTRWVRGRVHVVLSESEDHFPPAMESPDRSASAWIDGLPGHARIDLYADGNGSVFRAFSFSGSAPGADRALEAWGRAFSTLLRGRVRVEDHVLAPEAWLERARSFDVARSVVLERLTHAWVVDEREGRFALAVSGSLPHVTSYGEEGWAAVAPIGPVPRSARSVRIAGRRIGPDSAKDKPDLAILVPSLLGVPLPAVPEARRRDGVSWLSRWRVGPWVIQESKGTSYDHRWSVVFRLQEESGGTWAVFFSASASTTGADATTILVGDEASTREPEARIREWLRGWKLSSY